MSFTVARPIASQQNSDAGRVKVPQGILHHAMLQPAVRNLLLAQSEVPWSNSQTSSPAFSMQFHRLCISGGIAPWLGHERAETTRIHVEATLSIKRNFIPAFSAQPPGMKREFAVPAPPAAGFLLP